jgi:hypothetical protein
VESYAQAEEDLKHLVDGLSLKNPEEGRTCDFNGDGRVSIRDVIAFLLLARVNPANSALDWNGDGQYTIGDAVAFLQSVASGTCADSRTLLAGESSLAPEEIEGLSAEETAWLDQTIGRMRLSPDQKAALEMSLHGAGRPAELPRAFSLEQNSPNPFNPSTTIAYAVPEGRTVRVTLEVFNLRGALVRRLVDSGRGPGVYRAMWDGRDGSGVECGGGVYLYRLRAGEFVKVRKMVLLK